MTDIPKLEGMIHLDPERVRARCPHYHRVRKDLAGNIRQRQSLLHAGNRDPKVARAIWKWCAEDPLFYINLFGWALNTKDHAKSPVRPHITDEQQDYLILTLLESFGKEDVCVTKSRDVGGTETCLKAIEWAWHFLSFQSFLVTSRKEELVEKTGDTRTLFYRFDFLHRHQPPWLLPTGRILADRDPNRIKRHLENADNGSVIDGEATGGDLAVGDKRTAIFLDERALMANNAGISLGTREATLCRISNSTPRGVAGDAAEFWKIHQNQYIKSVVLHWSQHPLKSKGLYTSIDGRLVILDKSYEFPDDYEFTLDGDDIQGLGYRFFCEPDELHRQQVKVRSPWYDKEVRRANSQQEIAQELDINFLQSGSPFFDLQMIDTHIKDFGRTPLLVGEIQEGVFKECRNGRLKLWFTPRTSGKVPSAVKYTVGCDVATGVGSDLSSNSAASVIDIAAGKKVAEFTSRSIEPSAFADYAVALCKWLNNAYLNWDANGPTGGMFRKRVIELRYSNLYYRPKDELSGNRKRGRQAKPGLATTNETKATLLDVYGRALRSGTLRNPSIPALQECNEYVRQPGDKIEHAQERLSENIADLGTNHGDRVIADAWAWWAAIDRPLPKEEEASLKNLPKEKLPYGSMAYLLAEHDEDRESAAATTHGWT